MKDEEFVEESETDSFVVMCRERAIETVEQLKIFRAGRDFEKGDFAAYRSGASVVRYMLTRSLEDWKRLELVCGLDWQLESFDPEAVIAPLYFKKARELKFESWVIEAEKRANVRLDRARARLSEFVREGGKRRDRRFTNRATWIFEKEVEMLHRATNGKWNR